MENSVQTDYSELERELTDALKTAGDEQIRNTRELMSKMADSAERQVVFTSYPACNSEG